MKTFIYPLSSSYRSFFPACYPTRQIAVVYHWLPRPTNLNTARQLYIYGSLKHPIFFQIIDCCYLPCFNRTYMPIRSGVWTNQRRWFYRTVPQSTNRGSIPFINGAIASLGTTSPWNTPVVNKSLAKDGYSGNPASTISIIREITLEYTLCSTSSKWSGISNLSLQLVLSERGKHYILRGLYKLKYH